MNMKYVFVAFCLACAASVRAEGLQYLYWQVDLESSNPYSVPEFSYATLSDNNGASYLSFYDTYGVAVGTEMGVDGWEGYGDTGKTAGPLYSGFDAETYSDNYLFELWQENVGGGVSRVGWATYTYAQLEGFIYKDMEEGAGATALSVVAIPEPSSAVLLLIGLAGLALRRRRKAVLVLVSAFSLHFGAFAAANNLLYTVNRDGVDTYADGTQALDGEHYALVFLPTGSTGVEFAADCTIVDSSKGQIIETMQPEENGESFCFQVDAAIVDPLKGKGSWAVYLLDTRTYGENGVATVAAVGTNGRPICVNASKKLEDAVLSVSKSSGPVEKTAAGEVADTTSVVPADTPNPLITGIEIVDGKVHVKVSQTVPYLQYNLAAGETIDGVEGKKANSPRNGVAGGEIELVAPASANSGFFKVNRN